MFLFFFFEKKDAKWSNSKIKYGEESSSMNLCGVGKEENF